ncbi:MAG: 2-C-methyl-D-erythritol 4-phosphate cytidylyltransferase [Pseudomonadales bacterium]|nr:2-C-methyl-D-erythritol 4-phosphate cytidylyltransferase [Pseudomonadales bacterium]
MQQRNNYWAIVPAAGTGQRFGCELPKQYARLDGREVILHSLQALAESQRFERIVVAISQHDTWFGELALPSCGKFQVVQGGESRAMSVLHALQALSGLAGSNDWVLVHDAARPLLSQTVLSHLISTLDGDAVGGILATQPHDTIKLASATDSTGGATVTRTLNRDTIWQAQTPQMFRYGLLCDAMQAALSGAPPVKNEQHDLALQAITDESNAVERAGLPVQLVQGDPRNLKITTQADLALAEFYLRETANEQELPA